MPIVMPTGSMNDIPDSNARRWKSSPKNTVASDIRITNPAITQLCVEKPPTVSRASSGCSASILAIIVSSRAGEEGKKSSFIKIFAAS
ncbi:hypothetical protein R83H12_02578 [Fibrobacteria bacterium R8-3-H12]